MSNNDNYEEDVLLVTKKRFDDYKKGKLPLFIGLSLINAVLSLIDSFISLNTFTLTLGTIITAFTQIAYLYTFRTKIILPFRLCFSLPRKIISTWTNRLAYLSILLLLQLLRPIPIISMLAPLGGAGLILFNTIFAYRYNRWQFEREKNNKGLLFFEKAFILLVSSSFMFAIGCVTVCLYFLGLVIECVVDTECSIWETLWNLIAGFVESIGIGQLGSIFNMTIDFFMW